MCKTPLNTKMIYKKYLIDTKAHLKNPLHDAAQHFAGQKGPINAYLLSLHEERYEGDFLKHLAGIRKMGVDIGKVGHWRLQAPKEDFEPNFTIDRDGGIKGSLEPVQMKLSGIGANPSIGEFNMSKADQRWR